MGRIKYYRFSLQYVTICLCKCLIRSFCLSAAHSLQKCTSFNTITYKVTILQSQIFFYLTRFNSETRPRPPFCDSCATVTLHSHRRHVTFSFLCHTMEGSCYCNTGMYDFFQRVLFQLFTSQFMLNKITIIPK